MPTPEITDEMVQAAIDAVLDLVYESFPGPRGQMTHRGHDARTGVRDELGGYDASCPLCRVAGSDPEIAVAARERVFRVAIEAAVGTTATRMPSSEDVAQQFHTYYERLAPDFGYKTREASAKPWADVPEANRRLMIAVADEVLAWLASAVAGSPASRTGEPDEDRVAPANHELAGLIAEHLTWAGTARRHLTVGELHDRVRHRARVLAITATPGPGDIAEIVMEMAHLAAITGYDAAMFVEEIAGRARAVRDATAHEDATEPADHLEPGAGVASGVATPRRDDDVATWIRRRREEMPADSADWYLIDGMLDNYRLHADTGVPLDRDVHAPPCNIFDGCPVCGPPAENPVLALHSVSGLRWSDIARMVGAGTPTAHRWAAGVGTDDHRRQRVLTALAEFRALPVCDGEAVSRLAGELTRRFAAESGAPIQGPDAIAWFDVRHDRPDGGGEPLRPEGVAAGQVPVWVDVLDERGIEMHGWSALCWPDIAYEPGEHKVKVGVSSVCGGAFRCDTCRWECNGFNGRIHAADSHRWIVAEISTGGMPVGKPDLYEYRTHPFGGGPDFDDYGLPGG